MNLRTVLPLACLLAGCSVTPPQPATFAPLAKAPPPLPRALVVPMAVAAPTAPAAPATTAVTLAWSDNDPLAVGYRLYQGDASRQYTNSVDAGSHTNATISVQQGVTSYFAATAYGLLGVESGFSAEVSFTPPVTQKKTVAVIHTYVETSTNNLFNSWVPVQTFADVYVTNPPPILFFQTRIGIDYTNAP